MSPIHLWNKITSRFSFLKNKFLLTSLLFIVWMLFFDQNNILDNRKYNREYEQLVKEKEYYLQKIIDDKRKLKELQTSRVNLEKFAREEYLMKKDNEDIFLIVED